MKPATPRESGAKGLTTTLRQGMHGFDAVANAGPGPGPDPSNTANAYGGTGGPPFGPGPAVTQRQMRRRHCDGERRLGQRHCQRHGQCAGRLSSFPPGPANGTAGTANATSSATAVGPGQASAQAVVSGASAGQAQATAQTNFGKFQSVQSISTSPVSGTTCEFRGNLPVGGVGYPYGPQHPLDGGRSPLRAPWLSSGTYGTFTRVDFDVAVSAETAGGGKGSIKVFGSR